MDATLAPSELAEAIRTVAAGGTVLRAWAQPASLGAGAAPPLAALTAREQEVLALLERGRSDAEIGAELGISARTAQEHVGHVLGKLGVRSRLEAVTLTRLWPI